MTPSNEHEREIVATTERVAHKILGFPVIHDIIATVTFTMSRSDTGFALAIPVRFTRDLAQARFADEAGVTWGEKQEVLLDRRSQLQ